MRKYDIANPYELLKDFTRGKATVSKQEYVDFIQSIQGMPKDQKDMLLRLTPATYVGAAPVLATSLDTYTKTK